MIISVNILVLKLETYLDDWLETYIFSCNMNIPSTCEIYQIFRHPRTQTAFASRNATLPLVLQLLVWS